MNKKKNNRLGKLGIYIVILVTMIAFVLLISAKKKDEDIIQINETKDDIPPIINLEEGSRKIIAVGEKFEPKVTAIDNVDGDITEKIEISGIDSSKVGEYEAVFEVIDNAGNKTKATQKVFVRNEISNGLPVLMYHFFYDNSTYWAKDSNWLNINDFEEQLKYLKENEFYFPTWEEVEYYIDGKTKLPERSVVLTVDDGDASFFDLAVPMLQKYQIPATVFVISEWYGWRYDKNMEYVIFESHSHSMHEAGANGKGRMVNWEKDKIIEDLKTSSNTLGGANVFCYPFGHYNDIAIEALKETGYKMAFTIVGGRISKGCNKYTLPRVRVTAGNSLSYFASSIK